MSRIAQPSSSSARTDQRKVYTDWANNRLKKAGHSNLQVTDLQKDIPDGILLPKIIQAVVQDDVPGILSSPDNEYEKKQNIEASVMFLQRLGINCSGFSAKDISDGNMRAILQLFFNLSQFKPKGGSENAETQQPTSRISRPVSPGLRMIHSVHSKSSDGLGMKLPQTQRSIQLSSNGPLSNNNTKSPCSSQSSSAATSPVTTPTTTPLQANLTPSSLHPSVPTSGSTAKPVGPRRHAGSTIPTGMDPLGQVRRVPYRPLNITGGIPTLDISDKPTKSNSSESATSSSTLSPPGETPKISSPQATPITSTNVPRPTGLQAPKSSSGGLKPPGSHSALKSPSLSSDSALTSSTDSLKSDDAGETKSGSHTLKSQESIPKFLNSKITRSNSSAKDSSLYSDRRKFPGSLTGRSTPTLGGERSGLTPPSSRKTSGSDISKPKTIEAENLSSSTEELGQPVKRSNTLDNSLFPQKENGLKEATSIPGKGSQLSSIPGSGNTKSSGIPGAEQKRSFTSGLMRPSLSKIEKSQSLTSEPKGKENEEKSKEEPEQRSSSPAAGKTTAEVAKPSSKLQRLTQLPPASKLKGPSSNRPELVPTKGNNETEKDEQISETTVQKNYYPLKNDNVSKSQLTEPKGTVSKLALLTRKPPTLQQPKSSLATSHLTKALTPVQSPSASTSKAVNEVPVEPSPPPKELAQTVTSAKSSNDKPPPLDVQPFTPETSPIKPSISSNDPRSSSSSIGSFGSNNSQSESSMTETPSPFSARKYVRRTSPEGMSVDETASPRDHKLSDLSHESELEKSKEEVFSILSPDKENTSITELSSIHPDAKQVIKRAHSLSPKASRRIFPLPTTSNLVAPLLAEAPSSDENLNIDSKPKRSALRSPRQPGETRADKHVKISPHSSADSFSSEASLSRSVGETEAPVIITEQKRKSSQTERPKSMEDLESHKFSLSGFPGDLHPSLVRRGSTRSEKLDYSDVETFLETGLQEGKRNGSSTPELLETYENQLSHLKKDLESKARMLTMYETSMADLSSTVTSLKRSLEEKDAAIKHLTEERHRWQDLPFDSHSLAPSRLANSDMGMLSDGALSDGGIDMEKDESPSNKKKKKPWKRFSLRQKRNSSKKEQEMNQLEVASLAGSVIGTSKSLKRGNSTLSSRTKPSDLISISEYSTAETRTMRDFDTKSMDNQSEYGTYMTPMTMEEMLTIYEEEGSGQSVIVELLMDDIQAAHEDSVETITLGTIQIPSECSWVTMDNKICNIFNHHINSIDQEQQLGLKDDSIMYYMVDNIQRSIGNALLPFITPHQAVQNDSRITIALKGAAQESCDALAYKFLINVDVLQSYIAMIQETQWIVVMGTKGTCKTSLAEGLVSYLELIVKEEEEEDDFMIDETDKESVKRFNIASAPGAIGGGLEIAMKYMRQELPRKMERSATPILLFDGIYDCQPLEQLFNAAGTLPKRPYIVSTLCSGSTRGIPLHQLMFRHNIRVVTCSPQAEPIYGILSRTLRKQVYRLKADPSIDIEPVTEHLLNWLPYLLEHLNYFISKFHSNNVALGPRVFMNCPLDSSANEMEVWFINLWNHFIIPYLMGTIMAGIETYSADPHLDWIDVREWVIETYPWQPSHNISKLKTLTPDDVGWNHAVRPQQSRFMYMRDEDTQSVLRLKPTAELTI